MMCSDYFPSRFNSGKFGVPWEHTEAILNEIGVEMAVYSPE